MKNESRPLTREELSKLTELRYELAAQHHLDTCNRALINNTMFAIDELVGLIERIRYFIYDQRKIIETDEEHSRSREDEAFIEGKGKIILELIRACNMYEIIS